MRLQRLSLIHISVMGNPLVKRLAALHIKGTNSEHNVASTTQMTISVASAASQRGTFQPLTRG